VELKDLTIDQVRLLLDRGEASAVEICQAHLDSIEQRNPEIKALIHSNASWSLQQAARIDQLKRNGQPLPVLAGVPLAIKDNISIQGQRCTCGSKILENYTALYDATVIEKLRAAGAVFVGKANMDEFAMGSSTETSYFGVTRNPWNLTRVPGGSSGGSAAAVAADECIAATGSDTGGSIRQPASLCGIVGLKPTYGRISRFGLIAFASSLDQIGPMTKDVEDTAILLNFLSGHDPLDSTSINLPVPDYTKALKKDLKGMKIGIPEEYFIEGLDPEVKEAIEKAIKVMEGLGAKSQKVSLPHTRYALAIYYLIAPSEASSNLARYDGVKYGYRSKDGDNLLEMYINTRSQGFGQEVKRRIMLGTYALSAGYYDAYYRKASQGRTLIRKDFEEAFKECDLIVTPTGPTPAFKIGEKTSDPLQMYLSDIFTIPCNLAGLPGISIPCGFSKEGLPIGLQLLAPSFQEEKLIHGSYAYEQATEFHLQRPRL
jgi:aspartyl-tRNA(Asn)/glutamyl-tRNA(Gln) amidotransferase subunit A